MLIKKTAKALVAEIERITGEAGSQFGQQEAKLKEAIEDGTVTHWLNWNALPYAYTKRLFAEWTSILTGVTRMFNDEGKTLEDVAENLRGYRDGIVQQVLQADQCNKSTSIMSNALADGNIQVLRSVAGANSLSSDSLYAILLSLGKVS
jgi:hypothetical protein